MTTPLKRRTNRLNAKKSTGPRSSAGLRAVSKNATRHGMLGNSLILPGESEDRFLQMSQNFHNEHSPTNETERALVDMMAAARWRQMRIWGIERAIVSQEMIDQAAQMSPNEPEMDITTRAALAFRSLADKSRSLDLINRYETANARLFFRALHRLTSLRNDPAPQQDPPAETPETENFQTKPNVDFPEQNQEPTLLKNDQEDPSAQSVISPDSCLLTPDSPILTPDSSLTKPDVDFPEPNQEPTLLKNDQGSQPAQSGSTPVSCLLTPDSPLPTPDSAPAPAPTPDPRNNWNGPHHAVRSN